MGRAEVRTKEDEGVAVAGEERRGRKDKEERSGTIHTQQWHARMYRVQTTRHTLSRMRAPHKH